MYLNSTSASDTGTTIYSVTGDENLILDPLMEGTRNINAVGYGKGYALGLHWEHSKYGLHAGYRSSVDLHLEGGFTNYFNTFICAYF